MLKQYTAVSCFDTITDLFANWMSVTWDSLWHSWDIEFKWNQPVYNITGDRMTSDVDLGKWNTINAYLSNQCCHNYGVISPLKFDFHFAICLSQNATLVFSFDILLSYFSIQTSQFNSCDQAAIGKAFMESA